MGVQLVSVNFFNVLAGSGRDLRQLYVFLLWILAIPVILSHGGIRLSVKNCKRNFTLAFLENPFDFVTFFFDKLPVVLWRVINLKANANKWEVLTLISLLNLLDLLNQLRGGIYFPQQVWNLRLIIEFSFCAGDLIPMFKWLCNVSERWWHLIKQATTACYRLKNLWQSRVAVMPALTCLNWSYAWTAWQTPRLALSGHRAANFYIGKRFLPVLFEALALDNALATMLKIAVWIQFKFLMKFATPVRACISGSHLRRFAIWVHILQSKYSLQWIMIWLVFVLQLELTCAGYPRSQARQWCLVWYQWER